MTSTDAPCILLNCNYSIEKTDGVEYVFCNCRGSLSYGNCIQPFPFNPLRIDFLLSHKNYNFHKCKYINKFSILLRLQGI